MNPTILSAIRATLETTDLYARFERDVGDPAAMLLEGNEYALMFDSNTNILYFVKAWTSDTDFAEQAEAENENLTCVAYISALELLKSDDIAQHIIGDLRRYIEEKNIEGGKYN